MEYKEINDYELLSLVKEQSESAEEIIIDKYKNVINRYVGEFINEASANGLDYNDLFQEGLLGLHQAINTFNENKEASFYTYACICIKTSIQSIIRKYAAKKHSILNSSLSLDKVNATEENTYHNIVSDEIIDLSEQLLKEEEKNDLLIRLNKELAPFEKEVLSLKLKSYTNEEISKLLDKDRRSIENALFRIRNKYKKIKEGIG